MNKRRYQPLESKIRDMLEGKNINEAEVTTAPKDPFDISEPQTSNPDKKKKTPKDSLTASSNDPSTITIGQGNPVDLAPSTDDNLPPDDDDKKNKRPVHVEEREAKKTLGTGIHFGNYQRKIGAQVKRYMARNQKWADENKIQPKNEEANDNKRMVQGQNKEDKGMVETKFPILDSSTTHQTQTCQQKEKVQIDELSKPENERINLYHRAGNAEADNKHRKDKIVNKVRQTIAGVAYKQKKSKTYEGHGPHIPLAPVPIVTRGYIRHEETILEARDKVWKPYAVPGTKGAVTGFKETRPLKSSNYFRGYYGEITAGSKEPNRAIKRYKFALSQKTGVPVKKIPKMHGEETTPPPIQPVKKIGVGTKSQEPKKKQDSVSTQIGKQTSSLHEAGSFDPFAAVGQLAKQVLTGMAKQHRTRQPRQPKQSKQLDPNKQLSNPSTVQSDPQRQKHPVAPPVIKSGVYGGLGAVRAFQGIDYIQDMEKYTGKKFSIDARDKVDWTRKYPLGESQLNEVSMDKLQQYIQNAVLDYGSKRYRSAYEPYDRKKSNKMGDRFVSIDRAVQKLGKGAKVKATEEIMFEVRHIKGDPLGARQRGADTESDDHIINQLRKATNIDNFMVKFQDKSKAVVDKATATRVLQSYEQIKSPEQKLNVTNQLQASHQSFQDVLAGKIAPSKSERRTPSMPHGFKPKGLPF